MKYLLPVALAYAMIAAGFGLVGLVEGLGVPASLVFSLVGVGFTHVGVQASFFVADWLQESGFYVEFNIGLAPAMGGA